jgi:hypothetical protein
MGVDVPKNLIYFIYYGGKITHYHRLNLKLLLKYWHVFDGKKVVKVAIDCKTFLEPLKSLLPSDCEIEIVQNNPVFGESVHFIDSINKVNDGITFYAHCKGVSRPIWRGLDLWIEHSYKGNLETIPDLSNKVFSGVCGKLLACPPYVPQDFHYSGSFYWFNTEKVKARLKDYEMNRYLTERFPAIIAKRSECLFAYPYSEKNLNFYDEKTWAKL